MERIEPADKKPQFQLSVDVRLLSQMLAESDPDQVHSYERMSEIVGRDIQANRSILQSARRVVQRDHGIVFATVSRVGIQRITGGDVVRTTDGVIKKIRRSAKRQLGVLQCVGDTGELTRDEMTSLNLSMSMMGAMRQATSSKSIKQVESAVSSSGEPLAIAKTLEMFSR